MQMSHANHRRHHLDSGGHNQGNRVVNAGTPDEQELLHTQVLPMPGLSLYRVLLPARLPGIRCYTDASTARDTPLQVSRQAGLGVFIIDTSSQPPAAIYIKAKLQRTTSVLTAEAAALSLAGQIVSALGALNPFFLTDSQQLVTFLNGNNHTNPPRWDIKNTQDFINHTSSNNAKIFKVARKLNTTAHILVLFVYLIICTFQLVF